MCKTSYRLTRRTLLSPMGLGATLGANGPVVVQVGDVSAAQIDVSRGFVSARYCAKVLQPVEGNLSRLSAEGKIVGARAAPASHRVTMHTSPINLFT